MPRRSTAAASDRILERLRAGVVAAAELEHLLGQSQPTVSRLLKQLMESGRVVRFGERRGARYAVLREIRRIGSSWPLHRVLPDGRMENIGNLHALAADQYWLVLSERAAAAGFTGGGLTHGLPYFLQDQRPGGFLGRAVPTRYPELELPQRVVDWNDDHYLLYLTIRGSDAVGDLILGREALDGHLAAQRSPGAIDGTRRSVDYPRLADEVMKGSLPGSSAHGEHPKFAAAIDEADGVRPVLVKFSPPVTTAAGIRWSDLLIAEHLAHESLRTAGIPATSSRIFQFGQRAFLEVDRFDRSGAAGRVGVTSLLAIDSHLHGRLDNWTAAAERLHRDRRIDGGTLETIRLIDAFGALIANTDRHFGNIAFFDDYTGKFRLAPVYDMLPMLFSPEHDQIIERSFDPPGPSADVLAAWPAARALAEDYWRALVQDSRISDDFREISSRSLASLESMPRTGAYGG